MQSLKLTGLCDRFLRNVCVLLAVTLTIVFEDADGGPRQASAQHQGGVVQLITQNQTALQHSTENTQYELN